MLVLLLVSLSPFTAVAQHEFRNLDECEAKIREYEGWATRNLPRHNKLMADYGKLESENQALKEKLAWRRVDWVIVLAFVLSGLTVLRAALQSLIGRHPVPPARKQLLALVVGVLWIGGVWCFAQYQDYDSFGRPWSSSGQFIIVWSISGILFSAIGFWWFGKQKQDYRKAGL